MRASANAAGCLATSVAVTAAARNVPASRNWVGGLSPGPLFTNVLEGVFSEACIAPVLCGMHPPTGVGRIFLIIPVGAVLPQWRSWLVRTGGLRSASDKGLSRMASPPYWSMATRGAILFTTYQRTLECTRDPGSLRPDLHRCPTRRGHTREAAERTCSLGRRRAC